MNLFAISEIYHQIFSPQKKEDIFWGEMTFVHGNPGEGYWETTHIFPPTGDIIYLFVSASDKGPTQKQNDFYAQIRADYKKVENLLKPIMYRKWKSFNREEKKPRKFTSEFKVASVNIPPKGDEQEWEITFLDSKDYLYTAVFKNGKPISVSRGEEAFN